MIHPDDCSNSRTDAPSLTSCDPPKSLLCNNNISNSIEITRSATLDSNNNAEVKKNKVYLTDHQCQVYSSLDKPQDWQKVKPFFGMPEDYFREIYKDNVILFAIKFNNVTILLHNIDKDPTLLNRKLSCLPGRYGINPSMCHLACYYARSLLLGIILKKGANPNIMNNEGITPLHLLLGYDSVKKRFWTPCERINYCCLPNEKPETFQKTGGLPRINEFDYSKTKDKRIQGPEHFDKIPMADQGPLNDGDVRYFSVVEDKESFDWDYTWEGTCLPHQQAEFGLAGPPCVNTQFADLIIAIRLLVNHGFHLSPIDNVVSVPSDLERVRMGCCDSSQPCGEPVAMATNSFNDASELQKASLWHELVSLDPLITRNYLRGMWSSFQDKANWPEPWSLLDDPVLLYGKNIDLKHPSPRTIIPIFSQDYGTVKLPYALPPPPGWAEKSPLAQPVPTILLLKGMFCRRKDSNRDVALIDVIRYATSLGVDFTVVDPATGRNVFHWIADFYGQPLGTGQEGNWYRSRIFLDQCVRQVIASIIFRKMIEDGFYPDLVPLSKMKTMYPKIPSKVPEMQRAVPILWPRPSPDIWENVENQCLEKEVDLEIENEGNAKNAEALAAAEAELEEKKSYKLLMQTVNAGYDIIEKMLCSADKLGHTPLHYACARAFPEVVATFLKYGADPSIRKYPDKPDCKGFLPLHCLLNSLPFAAALEKYLASGLMSDPADIKDDREDLLRHIETLREVYDAMPAEMRNASVFTHPQLDEGRAMVGGVVPYLTAVPTIIKFINHQQSLLQRGVELLFNMHMLQEISLKTNGQMVTWQRLPAYAKAVRLHTEENDHNSDEEADKAGGKTSIDEVEHLAKKSLRRHVIDNEEFMGRMSKTFIPEQSQNVSLPNINDIVVLGQREELAAISNIHEALAKQLRRAADTQGVEIECRLETTNSMITEKIDRFGREASNEPNIKLDFPLQKEIVEDCHEDFMKPLLPSAPGTQQFIFGKKHNHSSMDHQIVASPAMSVPSKLIVGEKLPKSIHRYMPFYSPK